MRYEEAVRYLDSFIDYEKIGHRARTQFKLDRMRHIARVFGNPQDAFISVHIAGTKGKGSVASFTSSILKEARFNTGLYTSPHLVSPRERIRINGEMIEKEDIAFHVGEIEKKLKQEKLDFSPTFFEVYTILAFCYFRAKSVDYAVIETGLGGRLDATNVVNPVISAISPISYDHTHILGESLEEIASEKSGIIKAGCLCVSAPQEESVMRVIRDKCESMGAELFLVGRDISYSEISHDDEKEVFDVRGSLGEYRGCESRLLGRHQIVNACLAVGITECLIRKGARVGKEAIENGIRKARNPGRCEILGRKPYVVLDGAQNRKSAKALKDTVKRNFKYKRLILVLGVSKDKDIKGICRELSPLADTVILTKSRIKRAEEPALIRQYMQNKEVFLTDSVKTALKEALKISSPEDIILVTGSFFVVGEAREESFAEEKLLV